MSTGWVKRNSNGRLVVTNSGQTIGKQSHLDALQNTGRSTMTDAEFTFGIDSDDVVSSWLLIQETADENTWERKIRRTDSSMPRYLEDLITDNPSLTIHEKVKTRYDEKVALRATKP